MPKSVRVLAILMPLAAWPMAAGAQEAVQMHCKTGTGASYNSETHERLKVKGREGAIRYVVTGDVRITCDDITIAADEIESISDEPTVTARGHVVFKQTGVSISAELAVVNRTTHLGTFFTVSGTIRISEQKSPGDLFGGLEPDAYFSGDSLEKTGPKTYVLTNGVLTTCTQPTPRWYMSFSGTITQGKHVYMRNLVLRVKNVPLLYLPAFYYPITETGRSTGFLTPTIGTSAINGFTLSNAFFLVLGRSMDATFFHNYFKKTGMGFGGEYRYLQTAGNGKAAITVLQQKAQLAVGSSTELNPAKTSFTFNADVNQRLAHGLKFTSHNSYFSSASAQQQYQQNVYDLSLRQSRLQGRVSGGRGRLGIGVNVNLIDTYTGETAQRTGNLPTVDFSISDKSIGKSRVRFGLRGASGYLVRRDNLEDPATDHSLWRTDVLPTVGATLSSLKFLRVTTSATWRFTNWSESLIATDPLRANVPVPISRQLFTAQVSVFGPALSRVYQPKPNNYAEKFQHSIEPFFNLSWNSPFHDAARIVQLDPSVDGLVGGTVSTDYGIRTRLIAKRWTGARGSATASREILTGSIGQSYFSNLLAAANSQQDSSNGLYNPPAASPFSPIALNVTGRPVDYATVGFTTRYDTHFNTVRDYAVSGGLSRPLVQVNAGWSKKHFIPGLPNYNTDASATNYLYANASLTHPNKHFGGSYNSNLDLKLGRFTQQRYIVYYNSQCCGISFDYQTVGAAVGLPADRRFGFSFTLAGIGSFANPFGSFGGS